MIKTCGSSQGTFVGISKKDFLNISVNNRFTSSLSVFKNFIHLFNIKKNSFTSK